MSPSQFRVKVLATIRRFFLAAHIRSWSALSDTIQRCQSSTLFRNTIPTTEKYEVYEKMELAEKLKRLQFV